MEKKIVLTIREDIYLSNDKTEAQASELLNVISRYGTVEDFDSVIAVKLREKEEIISNLGKQLEEVKDRAVTDGEVLALKAIREDKRKAVAEKEERIGTLEKALTDVTEQHRSTLRKIKSVIPEIEE
jgi:hypothetical protein